MACNDQFETDQGSNDLEPEIIQDATTLQSLNGDSKFPASTTHTDKYSETEDHKRSLDIELFKCSSHASEVNFLQEQLDKLGLLQEHIEYIIENGEKLMNKPLILSKKLKITIKIAEKALGILKMYKQTSTSKVSPEIISKIQDCLKENPEIENHEDISILCDIEEALISEYFRTQPLTEKQKFSIKEKYNTGYPISDIANILKISEEKVKKFVEESFLTFSNEEGKIVLEIIQNISGEIAPYKLRKKIIDRDLKLQDQLCCILPDRNDAQYNELKKYFKKYEESKYFFELDTKLTTEDISYINQYGANDIEELSIKLQKVESVIRKYLEQYLPDQKLIQQCQIEQNKQIQNLLEHFGNEELKFHSYRMVIVNSFEEIMKDAELPGKTPKEIFQQLLPLTFYYLKCSLPFDDITQILANTCNISLTNHEIFHMIFQLSDPILRGFCIEHYSFSNPVPFYYPILSQNDNAISFKPTNELWYSMESFNGLISFGIGRAGWNQMGKSYLLDLTFGTDFVNASPQKSAFHSGSIDIQMTKNLFGEKVEDKSESTKWAYLDCQGNTKFEVINAISQHLDIALVHISYNDYINRGALLENDILKSTQTVKRAYFLIRDYNETELKRQEEDFYIHKSAKLIFVPNLTNTNINIQSVKKRLREIGHEILHQKSEKNIGGKFLESVLDLKHERLNAIRSDNQLVMKIKENIISETKESDKLNFSSFNYYPLFVKYMNCFYKSCYETDQKLIDKLNGERQLLNTQILKQDKGEVVDHFNQILDTNRSTLILWKLSQELSQLSNELFPKSVIEQNKEKFTLEILWRETLLYIKYGNLGLREADHFKRKIASNYSKHVEMGEAFELIDGDNLSYFDKEIDSLLAGVYEMNKGKEAPIVVSIFGPQSSGKSTLLNYCFGCKFLTSAGRCTRGIYGSLSRLSRKVNGAHQLLILDTEGLDAIERKTMMNDIEKKSMQDTSIIHFDRTMVLFCLAVSQVVIINVKGDIGSQMQNMLQICAYALNKLKVRKVPPPKIFFVLNQQADPDPEKHLESINILMNNINRESYMLDTEGVKMSDLIQITKENLFILPSAFNSDSMNKPNSKLFDSDVIKLSPTISFAEKCAKLRLSIIDKLDNMKTDEIEHFQTMSEWIQMSGTVWDTIINYQDIVKYDDYQEIKCSELLNCIISEIMEKHIYSNKNRFNQTAEKLTQEIQDIKTLVNPNQILTSVMQKFDDTFNIHYERCLTDFLKKNQDDRQLRELPRICSEAKSNLLKLLYIVKKEYEDSFKFQINAVLTEIKLSQSMIKFQELIIKNVDKYLEINVEQQKCAFETIWAECFGNCDLREEEENEINQSFSKLYSIFMIESKGMEKMSTTFELFRSRNFQMKEIIKDISEDTLARFQCHPTHLKGSERVFYVTNRNNQVIKEMTPYIGKEDYEYFSKDYFFGNYKLIQQDKKPRITGLAPKECHPLINYCSGYFNHPDIIWGKLNKESQILLLVSQLRDPNNTIRSTWDKLLKNIKKEMKVFIEKDPNISPATVREMVNYQTQLFKIVNYEIGFIHAKLTNTAEKTIEKFVFALAFESIWEITRNKLSEDKKIKETKKITSCQYFLQKIENRKMVRGEWDREKMRDSDKAISQKFAVDFIESVGRGISNMSKHLFECNFNERKDNFSNESIFFKANYIITEELYKSDDKVFDTNHMVVQYICNRNELIRRLFKEKWSQVEDEEYNIIVSQMKADFAKHMNDITKVLEAMTNDLIESCSEQRNSEQNAFDSDSNFDVIDLKNSKKNNSEQKSRERESPFKAMVTYLKMYLDPKVNAEEFNKYFSEIFELDGVKIKKSDTYILCNKPNSRHCVLSEDLFKKLENTKMFNSENIFNIYEYITEFTRVVSEYKYEISREDFGTMVRDIKESYEKDVLGCTNQCPSCGKFCDRKLHPNDGKCQIKTGHQMCSMGGKAWKDDRDKSVVLFTCDDYKDDTKLILHGKMLNWRQFKEKSKMDWNWALPEEEKFLALQRSNQEKMKRIWDRFGQAIIIYYAQKGIEMKHTRYTSVDDSYNSSSSLDYNICFVIDGTGSMHTDIKKARKSVKKIINNYKQRESISNFKVVIYRDHCDKTVVEMFPIGNNFTSQHEQIQQFLKEVKATGGGDYPEAALDGLATAATKCKWNTDTGNRNIIIHIFDAPPHGDFPNYNRHNKMSDKSNCCCCNHGTLCPFEWQRDVWDRMKEFQIKYYGINTGKKLSKFEQMMKTELGDLNGNLQEVSKEQVDNAILRIFIDSEMH